MDQHRDVDKLFIYLKKLFNLEIGELAKQFFWETTINRYEIITKELKDIKTPLYKKIYQEWLKQSA